MKLMISLSLAVVMGLSSLAMAAPSMRRTPKGSDGQNINHPLYGGYSYKRVDAVTEVQVCSGRCLLAGLIRGTGATSASLTIRDSASLGDTATGSISMLLHFNVSETSQLDNPVVLPYVHNKGITAKLSSVAADEQVVVLYIDLDP